MQRSTTLIERCQKCTNRKSTDSRLELMCVVLNFMPALQARRLRVLSFR